MARPNIKREHVERGITRITRTYLDGPERVTFQIRYGDGAGRMVSDTFSTKAKARAELARARTRVMDGGHVSPAAGDVLFHRVAAEWVATQRHWKRRTRENAEWCIKKHLAPLATTRMKQFTKPMVARFRADLLSAPKLDGGAPAVSSVNRTMKVLNGICEHARQHGYLANNPCADLRALRGQSRDFTPPSQREVDDLVRRLATPEQHDRPSAHDRRWSVLVDTAAYTGLRAGELAGLKKSDLDFGKGRLVVRRSISDGKGGLHEDRPKSRASQNRLVTLDAGLLQHLRELTSALGPDDYVFGSVGRGGAWQPLRHNQFHGRIFKPVVEEMELGITFHDLRHFHASPLIAQGWSVLEVAKRLGHSRPSFTLDTYAHLFADAELDHRDRANALRRQPAKRPSKKPF